MSIFIDPFLQTDGLRVALIAGILVALTCAITGTFIVLRGLAFIGDALAHGVLPGIAVATLLGVSGIIGAATGAAIMVGGVSLITRRLRLSGDTAIGLLFVGMLALGVIIMSISSSHVESSGHVDLEDTLFGDLLTVGTSDLKWQMIALAIVGIIAFIGRRPFLLLSVDEGLALTSGFPTKLFHNVMLVMVALTVVASFRTVGTLLVMGMLIAPAATGALFANRITTMTLIAAGVGVISVYFGLVVSHHYDLPAGASIVMISVVIFAVCAGSKEFAKSLAKDEVQHDHPHSHGAVHV